MKYKTYACHDCGFVLSEEEFDEEVSDYGWVTCPVCWDYARRHAYDGLSASTLNMVTLFKKLIEEKE